MFASFINALLCCLLLASYFQLIELNGRVFLLIVSLILSLNILGTFLTARRNRVANRVRCQLAEMLQNLNICTKTQNIFEQLKLLDEELGKERTRLNNLGNRCEFLRSSLSDCAQSFRNINRTLNYLDEHNYEEIQNLIKTQNRAKIQNIAEHAKLSFAYETHYDNVELPCSNSQSACILLSDALESFVVAKMLAQQGFAAKELSSAEGLPDCDILITDAEYDGELTTLLLGSNVQKIGHLKRPYDRIALLKAVFAALKYSETKASLQQAGKSVLSLKDTVPPLRDDFVAPSLRAKSIQSDTAVVNKPANDAATSSNTFDADDNADEKFSGKTNTDLSKNTAANSSENKAENPQNFDRFAEAAASAAHLSAAHFSEQPCDISTPAAPIAASLHAAAPASSDVLIFLQNDLLNSQMLHEANKHASCNICVNSISELRRQLKTDYKIIILADSCVLYDYDAIKSAIAQARARNPRLFVMIHATGARGASFDFADWLFKDSAQAQIVEMIKKHL